VREEEWEEESVSRLETRRRKGTNRKGREGEGKERE